MRRLGFPYNVSLLTDETVRSMRKAPGKEDCTSPGLTNLKPRIKIHVETFKDPRLSELGLENGSLISVAPGQTP